MREISARIQGGLVSAIGAMRSNCRADECYEDYPPLPSSVPDLASTSGISKSRGEMCRLLWYVGGLFD